MIKLSGLVWVLLIAAPAAAQELFVSTEPASNMAAGSLGLRLNSSLYRMDQIGGYRYRLDPELMFGVNRNLMLHLNIYSSDIYQQNLRVEGAGLYAKYRFFSNDDLQSHFRMAVFGKISLVGNPEILRSGNLDYTSDEVDLDGNNSGIQAGLVATQLIHKLALAASVSYTDRWENLDAVKLPGQPGQAANYTFSAGYLLWPRVYKNFRETNINLYIEFLGSSLLDQGSYYLDAAPAIQFIFNSISRLDFSYRAQLAGDMTRFSKNQLFVRYEYNFLNVFKTRR